MDRVAGPYWDQVRDLIEDWFSHLSLDVRADVLGRLRSKDDRQANGAFFELYLHECLLRMGYTVTCHPTVEGTNRRPDFLAEKGDGVVYIEARSASPSDLAVGATARANTVYESLDKIDSPNFFLWIDVERQGKSQFRIRPLRSKLETWLRTLDPQDYSDQGHGRNDFPYLEHDAEGWQILFHAIPKSPEARGREGVRPLAIFGGGNAFQVQDEQGIRNALSDKGSAYGSLSAPYVVAVASNSFAHDYDVENALYGTEVVEFTPDHDGEPLPGVLSRRPDGYWYRGHQWDHRHVSAVLIVKGLHPARVSTLQPTLWEHPSPERTAPPLPMWRQSAADADADGTNAPRCPFAYASRLVRPVVGPVAGRRTISSGKPTFKDLGLNEASRQAGQPPRFCRRW